MNGTSCTTTSIGMMTKGGLGNPSSIGTPGWEVCRRSEKTFVSWVTFISRILQAVPARRSAMARRCENIAHGDESDVIDKH